MRWPPLMQNWVVRKPVAVIARRHRRGAERRRRRRSAPRCWPPAAARSMRWSRPPSRWRCASRGTAASAASASWSSTRPGGGRAEVVDFGPIAPAGLDPALFPLTGETPHRAVHLAARSRATATCTARCRSRSRARCAAMRWRSSGSAACRGAIWWRRRWRWPRQGLPVDWWVTLKTANAAADLRRYDESRRRLAAERPAAGRSAERRGAGPRHSAASPRRWRGSPKTGPRISTRARSPRRSPPMSAPAAACSSAEDLAQCRARIVPSLDIPYRGYSLHAARGLTAAPTLADVLDRLAEQALRASARRDLFRGADRRPAAGLSRAARRPRRHRAARRELHHPHHRDRPRGRHRGA